VGELPTWDIQVEEDESYVAGGFINHNSNPNLLNIPARKIPEYRELFIPKYDKLIVADISQQEPRILAALSGDKKLLDIFNTGQDIHLMVTRAAFNDDTIVKSDPRRDVGKIINLATSYGMTAIGLARKLGISVEEAERFLNAYFARFPQVYENKQKQQEFANRFGYVESITGRRIWINRHNYQWSNNAINAPIQSSAADFTKLWLYKLLTKCRKGAILYPVCNVVYDEIVADSPKELVDTYKTLILEAFDETAKELFPQVPFEMDMKVGKNWGCKHLEKEEE
jgi:DNA polymerase-1